MPEAGWLALLFIGLSPDEVKAVPEQHEPDAQTEPEIKGGTYSFVVPLTEAWVIWREPETEETLQHYYSCNQANTTAEAAKHGFALPAALRIQAGATFGAAGH